MKNMNWRKIRPGAWLLLLGVLAGVVALWASGGPKIDGYSEEAFRLSVYRQASGMDDDRLMEVCTMLVLFEASGGRLADADGKTVDQLIAVTRHMDASACDQAMAELRRLPPEVRSAIAGKMRDGMKKYLAEHGKSAASGR